MSTIPLSSAFSQFFLNGTSSTLNSYAVPTTFSWSDPVSWPWTLVSRSRLFTLVTTKSSQHVLPPHTTISNGLYLTIFFSSLVALYTLFILPFPRTTRVKQILAFPLLSILLLEPLLLDCPLKLNHMGAAVTAIAVSTRMVDLYYVQPWTGIPSRYSLKTGTGPAALAPKDAVARVKKDLHDTRSSNSNSSSNKSILADEKDTFLNWDMKRFRLEMWSPLRRFSYNTHASSSSSSSDSARLLRWQDLVPIFIVYHLILDVDIFYMSQFRSKDMEAMNIQQYSVCIAAAASFIIFQILSFYVTMAVIYGYSTGRQIDTSEWTMLESKLPCFAITPADFWINWQTLFRYLWVDLAFLPVQRYCKQYWGPDRVGDLTAKVMRQALPVMSVFALSGILHAYIVYAVWREPVWSQLLYFMLQGIAVVVTKAIERSFIGAWIKDAYNKGGLLTKWTLTALGWIMMMIFHALTLPFFMHPYIKHEMWIHLRKRSLFWWMYGH